MGWGLWTLSPCVGVGKSKHSPISIPPPPIKLTFLEINWKMKAVLSF